MRSGVEAGSSRYHGAGLTSMEATHKLCSLVNDAVWKASRGRMGQPRDGTASCSDVDKASLKKIRPARRGFGGSCCLASAYIGSIDGLSSVMSIAALLLLVVVQSSSSSSCDLDILPVVIVAVFMSILVCMNSVLLLRRQYVLRHEKMKRVLDATNKLRINVEQQVCANQ